MRMYDIIRKKRDGHELSRAEIQWFINGYTSGEIPDYQASALCMAIWFSGMTPEETTDLTLAMRDSGDTLHLENIKGIRVDKHSTGGVGDKTSLAVAPIVASLGITVAKMSGRGLGHTGGTVDKLEAMDGFRTDLTTEEFEAIVNETGIAIVGQSADLAPADKLLYALRDVTATVDSLPLIASSIMSKKLAADDDGIVLDVKTGSGAFMKTEKDSRALAELMVQIGKRAGKHTRALITDMDRPLGRAIGNSLEVIEAIDTLNGHGPADFTELCIALATHMLILSGHGTADVCEADVKRVLQDGTALGKMAAMVQAQGGDPEWVFHPDRFPKAPFVRPVRSPETGFIGQVNCEAYGTAALVLGAGRNTMTDIIDPTAGLILSAKTGDFIRKGDVLATLYTSDQSRLDEAESILLGATVWNREAPTPRPLILGVVE